MGDGAAMRYCTINILYNSGISSYRVEIPEDVITEEEVAIFVKGVQAGIIAAMGRIDPNNEYSPMGY